VQTKQYDVCLNVLRRLEESGVLRRVVLVGSWCLVLYREYFRGVGELSAVRTRDMDFLVPKQGKMDQNVDVPTLLKDLGFIVGFRGEQGAMMLEHPELMIEFLVAESGRGSDKLKYLPELGMNAQPLRFMDIASSKTVLLHFGDVPVTVPHPAAFVLHKLLVVPRRREAAKREKDLAAALAVLQLLETKGDLPLVREVLDSFSAAWKKTILRVLQDNRADHWVKALA
jgi:hypothetical protein